jgi:hypothetical protein
MFKPIFDATQSGRASKNLRPHSTATFLEAVMHTIHHLSDGSIDYDFYRQNALQQRSAYMNDMLSGQTLLPSMSVQRRRRVKLFAAAFALATAAFWSTMLTVPPTTEAGAPAFSVDTLQRNAPLDLPTLSAEPT